MTLALATPPEELNQWLQQGINAAKAGQREQARFRLLDVVESDQTNEAAWYWLYQVFERRDDKRICLENLILLNPQNLWAKEQLLNLLDASEPQKPLVAAHQAAPQLKPVSLKLVTAFWAGISLIFLGSGIISILQWLIVGLTQPVTVFPLLDLTLGVIFIMAGVVGFCVTLALYFQANIGIYGSLFLALGLLLVGPAFSLIANPPNYAAMTCTGGVSGMIVLLTLASQSGFKNGRSPS